MSERPTPAPLIRSLRLGPEASLFAIQGPEPPHMVIDREGAVESKVAGRFRFGKRAGRRCCSSMLSSATRYRLRRGRTYSAAGRPNS